MKRPDYRIPIVDRERLRTPHNNIPLDVNDNRFNEPLVNLIDYSISFESYHAKSDGENPPYYKRVAGSRTDGWLRESIARKLVEVNNTLEPYGVEIHVFDAYRSMECQQGLWQFFYDRGKTVYPQGNDVLWTEYALGYVRDPRNFDRHNSATFPAHATGASIDATLRYLSNGEFLDMGSQFEEITEVSYNDYFERQLNQNKINEEDIRLQNRRLMHWALSMHDFLNDPILFWHYDWGNQLYVKVKQALCKLYGGEAPSHAWYGYIDPPASNINKQLAKEEITV